VRKRRGSLHRVRHAPSCMNAKKSWILFPYRQRTLMVGIRRPLLKYHESSGRKLLSATSTEKACGNWLKPIAYPMKRSDTSWEGWHKKPYRSLDVPRAYNITMLSTSDIRRSRRRCRKPPGR
jgi:hypothetical protein